MLQRVTLVLLGLVSVAALKSTSQLATRRWTLARAAALAGSGALWQQAALAEDGDAPLEAPEVIAAEAPGAAPPELPPAAPPTPPLTSAFDFDVPFRGEPREIKPFLGRASLLVNVKLDDPETLDQLPALNALHSRLAPDGLHVLAFPTDQGWFEADDSNTLRLKFKSVYDFGQFPSAVVFDKADLLGGNALPLYAWMTNALGNPWGVNRIVFNYEKFLVDASGQPLRRYPRKFPIALMEQDVQAALEGKPLPPPSASLTKAWEDAKREALKSEYSFKPGLVRALAVPLHPIAPDDRPE